MRSSQHSATIKPQPHDSDDNGSIDWEATHTYPTRQAGDCFSSNPTLMVGFRVIYGTSNLYAHYVCLNLLKST